MIDSLSAVIVNFQTPDLLRVAVESFHHHYPQVDVLIVDNGSKDNSREVVGELERLSPGKITTLVLEKNIYHGPAMHQAIKALTKEYILFLDSDTETMKGGFLEAMQAEFHASPNTYGMGRHIHVNKRGFVADKGITILAPAYMMVRRNFYFTLPPFEHHGQPVLRNFIAAQQKGYVLQAFPIQDFIDHHWRGTASRFGYGLGMKGKIDFLLNKIGI
jgi:GT2 family glycosyltransferase